MTGLDWIDDPEVRARNVEIERAKLAEMKRKANPSEFLATPPRPAARPDPAAVALMAEARTELRRCRSFDLADRIRGYLGRVGGGAVRDVPIGGK